METSEKQKPIKRNENLVPLSREHHFGLLFCWKIRQGISKNIRKETVKNYVRYFWKKHLQQHLAQEEKLLATLLHPEDKMRLRLEDEHRELEYKIQKIISGTKEDNTDFSALADFLSNHIRFEERELFPYMEHQFSPEQLVYIGQKLKENDAAPDEDFTPEFWLRDYKQAEFC